EELGAEVGDLLGEGDTTARGHRRLLGEPGVELDEGGAFHLENLRKAPLEVVEVVDGEGCAVAGALRHGHEVHREPAGYPLGARGVIDAVLEEKVDEVARSGARDGGETSELHQERAVAVQHENAAIGSGESDAQAETGGAAHEADTA